MRRAVPTVMRLDDFMTDLPQVGGEHLGHIDVVINDEHPFRRGRAGTVLGMEALCNGLPGAEGKVHHRFCSVSDALTKHLRSATMHFGD